MRALVCAALGDPTLPPGAPGAALELRTLPTPKLGDKDVLIRAAAAALNFADALVVQGCARCERHLLCRMPRATTLRADG